MISLAESGLRLCLCDYNLVSRQSRFVVVVVVTIRSTREADTHILLDFCVNVVISKLLSEL